MLKKLKVAELETPLGLVSAIADEEALYLLEFVSGSHIEKKKAKLLRKLNAMLVEGDAAPLKSIKKELEEYFNGKLREFKTPLKLLGTPFQKEVWQALRTIPLSKTCSYLELAAAIGRPLAIRAVANANAANQLSIIVPCHRVIYTGGGLGGYASGLDASGLDRKKWLLSHESSL